MPFNSLIISPLRIPSLLALLFLFTFSTKISDEFLKLNSPKLLDVIISIYHIHDRNNRIY